jgi:hypothetical protein
MRGINKKGDFGSDTFFSTPFRRALGAVSTPPPAMLAWFEKRFEHQTISFHNQETRS